MPQSNCKANHNLFNDEKMIKIEEMLSKLISFKSITPDDAGCQNFLIQFLESMGFSCKKLDNFPVSNFFARMGTAKPMLIFAGHTDVVPVGDISLWKTNPFTLTNQNGTLFGRGVADMKGSIAAMLLAAQRFLHACPSMKGSLGFLITSGEEGDHFHLGTEYVMQKLNEEGTIPQYCIVGEPSSSKHTGDVIKIGRRGSLTGKLTLDGKQGHVAYPQFAINPIHIISPALKDLASIQFDEGNRHFPATSLQITHIHSGGESGNIIPASIQVQFNIRFSTEQTVEGLKEKVLKCFTKYDLSPIIEWRLNGEPFLTSHGQLLEECTDAIQKHCGITPEYSTSGGTSDGRFIAPYGVEVIELGPVNQSIHQINENVTLIDLEKLSEIYFTICSRILG